MAETEEKTYITPQCQAAMIKHGVLMKDGKPAGMALMNKPVLRIALVEVGENGKLPHNFLTFSEGAWSEESKYFNKASIFTQLQKNTMKRGIEFWYKGKMEFVPFDEDSDISIFAFKDSNWGNGGLSTLPENDLVPSGTDGVSDKRIIGINSDIHISIFSRYLQHEFGHSIGILHPPNALDVYEYKQTEEGLCSEDDKNKIRDINGPGIMAYGDQLQNWYDRGARDFVRTGIPPKPVGGMKP